MANSPSHSIRSRRGQTLVEALVALGILTMGLIGTVALLTRSFQLNRTVADDTQATYLAAEGIEIAKNIIDHDTYLGLSIPPSGSVDDWGCSFRLNPNTPAKDYEFDYTTIDPSTNCKGQPLPSVSAQKAQSDHLWYNASTTLYSYDSFNAQQTDFTRDVRIKSEDNGNDLDVQSIVTWSNGTTGNTITLEDHFYNWLGSQSQ